MEAIIAAINSDALKSAPSWLRVLEPFNTEFNEVRVFNKRWPDADKRAFLSASTQFLRSTPDVSTADKAAFIRAIKIVTRDRSGLLELFSDENIAYFLGLFHEQPEPSAAATDLALELHYLLFNMIMLSREKVVKSIFEKGSHAVALRRAKDESSDLATRFSVLRILFVLTLDDSCANTLIAEHGIVPFLIKYMNELASDDPSALASPAFKERRKSLSECYKIVFNLIMETNRPAIADHVPKELFDSFGSLLGRVLAAGVTDMSVIEEEMRKREIAQRERAVELATIRKQEEANQAPEPEDDDPAMSEEIEPLPGESDAAFMARLMNPGGVRAKAADGAKDATSSASKPAQGAPTATPSPAAPATVAPVAAPAPAPVPAESKEELDPNTADLYSLKDAASHCLIYMPEALATYIDRDMRSVHALCELLAYHSRRDPKRLEEELAPVCMTLCGLVKHSLPARRYIKRFVFGWSSNKENVAEVIGTKVGIAPQDSDFADADPNSLKAVLLRSITTFHFTLKSQVSELLWLLCDESSGEYIRLAGFGNAAGLLAEKGLPGFAHLKTQAYDIDELLKARKKL